MEIEFLSGVSGELTSCLPFRDENVDFCRILLLWRMPSETCKITG